MSAKPVEFKPLSGQIAVITGASRGIGEGIARRLSSMGATLVITARTEGPLTRTAQSIRENGGTCEAVPCDVTQLAQVEALARGVEKKFGKLNILVNNAGIGDFHRKLHEMAPEDWDRILNTNLRAPYYLLRAFVPLMIQSGGGHIVNISSLAGKNPVPNAAAYAASKWGLNGLSYSVAEELRGDNIRVSIVCPGSTHTGFLHAEGRQSERMLTADDVAHVVAMLVTQAPQSFVSEVLIRPTKKP